MQISEGGDIPTSEGVEHPTYEGEYLSKLLPRTKRKEKATKTDQRTYKDITSTHDQNQYHT